MNELSDKVQVATQNVEEAETLVNKLEKELIDWNGIKKLHKRDLELEELTTLCTELVDELQLESHNTEIELERNLEK